MKVTKTVRWTTKDGRPVEVIIEKTKEVRDRIAYADGWNVPLGKETVDLLDIEIRVAGNHQSRTSQPPHIVTKASYGRHYNQLVSKGVYARLGDVYINEVNYNLIMTMLDNIDAELTETAEYTEVKAAEKAKEAAETKKLEDAATEYQRLLDSGMCPKCQSWCYGDCELSR